MVLRDPEYWATGGKNYCLVTCYICMVKAISRNGSFHGRELTNSSRYPSPLSSRYFPVNISEYFILIKNVSIFVALSSHIIVSDTLRPHGLQPTRLLCPWEFSRQAYWNGLPFFSPECLPSPEIEPASPSSLLHCRWTLTTEPLNYYFF